MAFGYHQLQTARFPCAASHNTSLRGKPRQSTCRRVGEWPLRCIRRLQIARSTQMAASKVLLALLAAFLAVVDAQSSSSSSSSSSGGVCSADTSFGQLLSPETECADVCNQSKACVAVNENDASVNTSSISGLCSGSTLDPAVDCDAVTANDSSACDFLCLSYATNNMFVLLVAFGDYQSDEEAAQRELYGDERYDAAVLSLQDDSGKYATVSNDLVQSVGKLSFPSKITYFQLLGGVSIYDYLQGKVAYIEFGDEFLADQNQITYVALTSLDLKNVSRRLPSLLPPKVTTLSLDNVLMYEFPSYLESAFPSLTTLYLQWNYITQINSSVTFDSLMYLYLAGNNLTQFDATFPKVDTLSLHWNHLTTIPPPSQFPSLTSLYMFANYVTDVNESYSYDKLKYLSLINNSVSSITASFPALKSLYLDNNSLTEIPETIYSCSKLTELALTGNNINFSLTPSQYSFLQKLETLNISESTVTYSGCQSTQTLQGIKVCIISEAATPTNDSSGGGNTAAIAGGVAAGVVVLLIIALFFFCRRRRQKPRDSTIDTKATSDRSLVTLWSDPQLVALQLDVDAIEDIKQLGSGAFGVVWLVRYQGVRLLASKRLKADSVTRSRTQAFVNEIKMVARLDHPNIVALVGVAWTHEADLQALTEFVDGGDLREYLLASTDYAWSVSKLQIAIGAIDALAYVHSHIPPIVHRDIKSRNVLLTSNLEAKLTDFGASREQSYNMTMTQNIGTARWQAPEILAGSSDYDCSSDIFSFGVTLAELDSHTLPYEGARGQGGELLADIAILHLVAMGQLRPSFSSSCPYKLRVLAERCMDQEPKRRPTAVECAYKLRAVLKSLAR